MQHAIYLTLMFSLGGLEGNLTAWKLNFILKDQADTSRLFLIFWELIMNTILTYASKILLWKMFIISVWVSQTQDIKQDYM